MKSTTKNLRIAFIAAVLMLSLSFKTLGQNNTSWSTTTNIGIGGNKYLEFGYGVAGKDPNAGKIGYGTFSTGTLDIVGAGTDWINRKIKFFNEGGAIFTGSVGIGVSPTALLHVYGPSNPNFKLSNANMNLEIGIASCNGCYSFFALTNDIVIRPNGVISPPVTPKRIILSTGTTIGSGASIDINSDSHEILRVSDNNYVSIGTTTVPTSAPVGGYRLAVLGNTNLNGSVVVGNPASISSQTPFPTGFKLYVTEGILTEKVQVALKTTADWSDFVFAPDYNLMPLDSVECFIQQNKHLPDVPSAEEVVSTGIDLGKMDAKLLQKIEELTLYMIEMKKENNEMKKEIENLKQAQGK